MWKLVAVIGLAVVVAGCEDRNHAALTLELEMILQEARILEKPDRLTDWDRFPADVECLLRDDEIHCDADFAIFSNSDASSIPARFKFAFTDDAIIIRPQTGKARKYLARAGFDLACEGDPEEVLIGILPMTDLPVQFRCRV